MFAKATEILDLNLQKSYEVTSLPDILNKTIIVFIVGLMKYVIIVNRTVLNNNITVPELVNLTVKSLIEHFMTNSAVIKWNL